jgi:probable HAF family extracellular repeat protein
MVAVLMFVAGLGALPLSGVLGQATPVPADYTIHELPTLGGDNAAVVEVNDDGIAVGWSELRPGDDTAHATLWAGGEPVDLGTLGGDDSFAWDINDAGIVVGSAETAEGQSHAVIWRDGVITDLSTLGGENGGAHAVNGAGVVVGSAQVASGDLHAFRWQGGVMADLGTLGGDESDAYDITADGTVYGLAAIATGQHHAVRWDTGGITDLGTPGGQTSTAFAANAGGLAVGWTRRPDGTDHAVGWREIGSLDELDPADPAASAAVAVNAAGNIAGSTAPGTPDMRVVVWIAGQRTQLPGLNDGRSGALAITDAGVVGGYAADASDRQRPVLWMPSSAPPPAALSRPLAATPVGAPSASPPSTARSVVWDGIDVTVELRENSALRVTERNRIDFIGGPFRSGYREIPLTAIEDVDQITVGEVDGGIQAYRYVSPSEFSADNPNTYTYRVTGPTLRIDWSFPPTTSQSRTFQLDYDALGALRVYDDVETPYQQISWIGVDDDITENARVNNATLRFVLPQPVDPGRTVIQGPGSQQPEEHTTDGKTWVWTASNLGPGETLEASLQFPPLVAATKPSWQTTSDRAERQQAERDARVTPAPQGTPTASASPVVSSAAAPGASPVAMPSSIPPCTEVIEDDFYGKTRDLLADCTTDRPIFVPEEWVFDGGGHTIFAIDPDDGRLTGGVIMITGASGTVRHVSIDGSRLTAGCVVDRGQTALTGVVVRGASGEVSGVTVRNLARPLPAAAAPPTNPPESVSESCGTGIAVLGREANVTVIENVIENVGYVGVLVEVGQASISHTTIDRAADTGILALLGAHVRISPGNQIRNGFIGIQLEGEGTGGRVAGTTIERMALMGVAIIGGAQASIANNSIADTAVNGIAIEGETTEATIENNQLDDPGEVGIKGLQASVEVRGNRVSGGDFGIGIGDGGTAQVFGNTLNRPQNTGIYVLHEGTSATIVGNTVADAASDGIWVEQAARATITGNTVTDATSTGITAVAGATVTIAGENVVRGGERGIVIGGTGTTGTVTGNRVEGAGVVGITIQTGATAPDVSSNTITGARFGIATLGAGTSSTVTDNSVTELEATGYTVESGATAKLRRNHVTQANVGIYVDGLESSADLSENRIEQTTTAGIVLATGSQTIAASNTISVPGIDGIRITGAGTTATISDSSISGATETGIKVNAGAQATIEDGNQVTGGKWGISVLDADTTAAVHGNDVSGVASQGITVLYGARATVSDNAITGGATGVLVKDRGSAIVEGNTIREVTYVGISFAPAPPPVATTPAATSADGGAIVSRDISFDPTTITIPANTDVTVVLPNQGVIPHNFSIDELGIDVDIAPGATEETVINAPPGTYEYYCNVPGHKQAGMVGTLTVSADTATLAVATPVPAPVAPAPAAAAEQADVIRRNTIEGSRFGIVVRGAGSPITVEGNHVRSVGATGISIEDQALADLASNTVADASTGINIADGGTSATLTGNHVTDTTDRGIHVHLGADALLRKNTVTRAATSGIVVAGSGTVATLEGNIVSNAAEIGIAVESAATATIDKGNFISGGKWGISILSSVTSAEVRGNRVRNATNQGISVLYGASATVDGNTVEGGDSGIYVRYPNSRAVITGNHVSAEDEGIYVWEGATAERIADNTVSGGRSGIVVAGARSTAVVETNRVSDVSLEGIHIGSEASAEIRRNDVTKVGRSVNSRGIFITGQATTATIEENTLTDIRGTGILFNYGAKGTISGNTLTAVTNTGIRIDADTRVTVTGNTVRDVRAIGIEARASESTVTDNTVVNASQVGIQLGPDAAVTITGNTITGPDDPDLDRDGSYGIQALRRVTGTVTDNRVANHFNASPDYTACGVLIDAEAPSIVMSENLFPDPGNEVDMCDARPRLPASARASTATSAAATPVVATRVAVASPGPVASPGATPVPAATPMATPVVTATPLPAATTIPASTPALAAASPSPKTRGPVASPSGINLGGWVYLPGSTCFQDSCRLHLQIDPAAPGRQVVVVRLTDPQGSLLALDTVPTIEVTWTLLTSEGAGGDASVFSTVLKPDAVGSTHTGVVTLAARGWWEASVTVTAAGADAPYWGWNFWLVVPDPNATGTGPRPPPEPAAQTLFEEALASLTRLRAVHVATSRDDGRGGFSSWDTDVRAATAEQPAASVTWKYDTDGRRTGEMIIGDRRWVTVPGKGWVAAKPVPFTPPPAWDQLYTGATGFQFGPIQQLGRDEESFQVVTFWQPAEASPSGEPAWYVWWVGRDSGRLRREAVVSTDLYQVRSFSRFDEPVRIDPPPAPAPSTATPEPMLSTAATPTLPADGGPSATPPASTAGESGSVETPEASACAAAWQDNSATATRTLIADCTTEVPIELPNGWTFDGQGHTIRLVDPPRRFHGGVIKRRIRYTAQHHRQVLVAAAADGRSDGQLTR